MKGQRKSCRQCKRPATAARPISRRGLCRACGKRNLVEQNRSMASDGAKGDPEARQKWLDGMARAVEREKANQADRGESEALMGGS